MKNMKSKIKMALLTVYEKYSIIELENELDSARKTFSRTQTEKDALRCEIIIELMKKKEA